MLIKTDEHSHTSHPGGTSAGDGTYMDLRQSRPAATESFTKATAEFVQSWRGAASKLPRRRRLDTLLGLERLDENFHRYTFVKQIEKRIDAFVSKMLDLRLRELHSSQVVPHVEVPLLVEQIMSSAEYTAFVGTLVEDATKSVHELSGHDWTAMSPLSDHATLRQRQQHSQEMRKMSSDFSSVQSNSTNESPCGSISFNAASASFSLPSSPMPSIEEIRAVVNNLQSRNNLEIRLAAIKRLTSYPSMDLLCGEFWPDSKTALNTALCDADVQVVTASLRIYARAFRAAPPPMMGEVYLNLVGHLTHIFEPAHAGGKVLDGLCVEDVKVQLLLRKFRLLNQFQKEMTSCWIRFPEQLLKDVMLATFKFLNMSSSVPGWNHRMKSSILTGTAPGNSSPITPLHYLSIVDIGASWFEKWMISQFGRAHITAALNEAGMLGDLAARFVAHAAHLLRVSSSMSKTCNEVLVLDVEVSEDPEELVARRKVGMEDLEYVHFLHVLMMLGKLSIFNVGRRCFPIDLTEALGTGIVPALKEILGTSFGTATGPNVTNTNATSALSLPGVTNILIRLMRHCPRTTFSMYTEHDRSKGQAVEPYKLSRFVVRLLTEITVTDQTFHERLLENNVLCELIEPLRQATIAKKGAAEIDPDSLLDLAETLSNIAANDSGRLFLLEQERSVASGDTTKRKGSPAGKGPGVVTTVIALVKQTIASGVTSASQVKVLGAYVFFLRQLYRTCEGLRYLHQHDLHTTLAKTLSDQAWIRESDPPDGTLSDKWHPIALDNLLNFAGTPKGVLLLKLSGSMDPCVAYMAHRYEKKMQVSKCDKFGYGVLVSQISTTKSGMHALYSSGLFQLFFSDMWALLEHDDTVSVAVPPVEPLDDHLVKKMVGNLLKILASFPGLLAIMEAEHGVSGRNTLDFLMRTIVLDAADSCRDERSPGRYEESQLIALKILRLSTSSLDSYVALQERYQFREALITKHAATRLNPGEGCSIDETSLLRRSILVATYAMGGPGERRLPPTTLDATQSLAIPAKVVRVPTPPSSQAEIADLLAKAGKSKPGRKWLKDIQECLAKHLFALAEENAVDMQQFMRKLAEIVKVISSMPESDRQLSGWITLGKVPSVTELNTKVTITSHDEIAITLVVRYAKLNISNMTEERLKINFTQVLTESRKLIRGHRSPLEAPASDTGFDGFDWFLSTVFILAEGQPKPTMELLSLIIGFIPSMYLWPQRSHRSNLLLGPRQDISLLYSTCCHLVEFIAEAELPTLFSAFTLSGCTPSQISQRWMREVFWNTLPLPEIQNYLLLSLIMGIDYQIYFCIALLRHMTPDILLATRDHELISYLHESEAVGGSFKAGMHLTFMKELETKYREFVFQEMRDSLGVK
ncbi:hypothetical protein HKX48_001962 [Thoreauomyces humboldtii]|nr:hypothetical protein HKX48_001962 [Thoreauomyces humboldtii]